MSAPLKLYRAWILLITAAGLAYFGLRGMLSIALATATATVLGKLTVKAIRHFWSE